MKAAIEKLEKALMVASGHQVSNPQQAYNLAERAISEALTMLREQEAVDEYLCPMCSLARRNPPLWQQRGLTKPPVGPSESGE